jgi:hypothetical protein
MSGRKIFGTGAVGELVAEIQQALVLSGEPLKKADRVYGQETTNAVHHYQLSHSLSPTGVVDTETWQLLMQRSVPAVGERCLQLTATFEGHGFELAVGDFDGALLTWGIVGFTVTSGEVQSIVEDVKLSHPELVEQAFGKNQVELLKFLRSAPDEQKQWATTRTLKNGSLAEPWRSMFATFGSFPAVQAEQIKHVVNDYLNPAIKSGKKLGLSSELGLALMLDVHVQNGGLKPAALKAVLQDSQNGLTEIEIRKLIANAAADSARVAWREDVRQRKLTIATGQGTVHGHKFSLENWGLSGEFAAAELASSVVAGASAA